MKLITSIIIILMTHSPALCLRQQKPISKDSEKEIAEIINVMEANLITYHGLTIQGLQITDDEKETLEISVLHGAVTVCKIQIDGTVQDFHSCYQNASCVEQIEKCGKKYERRNIKYEEFQVNQPVKQEEPTVQVDQGTEVNKPTVKEESHENYSDDFESYHSSEEKAKSKPKTKTESSSSSSPSLETEEEIVISKRTDIKKTTSMSSSVEIQSSIHEEIVIEESSEQPANQEVHQPEQ